MIISQLTSPYRLSPSAMANALGFILNAAGLLVPLGLSASMAKEVPKEFSSVQIITGSGGDSPGGAVPHVALWDDDGKRIGQKHPGKHKKIGEGNQKTFYVSHDENGEKQADPYYVMLSNPSHDAICIAAITVANQKISATFYGDTGVMCGQSWYYSENRIGSNFQKPKCVWLDGDHTNGLNAKAMSFHVNDMAPAADKLAEYDENRATICQSTPRFSIWGNLEPDGIIPFFKPKLEYEEDSQNNGEGADKDPQRVTDKKDQYDKSVYMHQGERLKAKARTSPRRRANANGSNHDTTVLVITDHEEDDIRYLCEHPNSYGFDIVSPGQGLFCDMEHKQLYNVCNDQLNDNCFDMETNKIVPKSGLDARDELITSVPHKAYKAHRHWKN